ncbi:hypothetical protein BGZ57DRAFT_981673 [Hyaloscypha finlandica]|nr:hypothetical protein BGZ57DRAFT_981673 [Hyaloscypha finlandica]KAH8784122.1 hypothetical protein F5882DRAFT_128517 [Hyaloscypha sp. PMI_1271]
MPSPSSAKSKGLTDYLMGRDPEGFKKATQTPFLERAGKGTLDKRVLQQWLSQDRLYAQAYVRFASLLLANIRLPAAVNPGDVNEKLADLIVDSLTNIRLELRFFEQVATKYGLDINAREEEASEGVKGYRELFFSTGEGIEAAKLPLLDGLVLLWATEKCYLEAWTYASSFSKGLEGREEGEGDADGGALRKEFIPNWTSPEFEAFVEKIGSFVDVLSEQESEGKARVMQRVEELWRRVLDVEERFWPKMEA